MTLMGLGPIVRLISFRSAGKSEVGRVRDENEDAYTIDEARGLFILADGMGGHVDGRLASNLAVQTVQDRFSQALITSEERAVKLLLTAVHAAHDELVMRAGTGAAQLRMGSTIVVGLVYAQRLFIANVGDSRAYLRRGERLVQVTRDQNGLNEALDMGYFRSVEEVAAKFPLNLAIFTQLVQSLGGGTMDLKPVITVVDLKQGDRLLLCSDGLTRHCEDAVIDGLLCMAAEPSVACGVLIDAANANGGSDNITTIIVVFDDVNLPLPTPDDSANLAYQVYVPRPSDSAA